MSVMVYEHERLNDTSAGGKMWEWGVKSYSSLKICLEEI